MNSRTRKLSTKMHKTQLIDKFLVVYLIAVFAIAAWYAPKAVNELEATLNGNYKAIQNAENERNYARKEAEEYRCIISSYQEHIEDLREQLAAERANYEQAVSERNSLEQEYEQLLMRIRMTIEDEEKEYTEQGLAPSQNIEALKSLTND